MALELSSVDAVANHLRLDSGDIDDDLTNALDAARELISADVELGGSTKIPAALHRAAMLLAAQLWKQEQTVSAVDASYQGVPGGSVFAYTPIISRLIRPWTRPRIGVADRVTGDVTGGVTP